MTDQRLLRRRSGPVLQVSGFVSAASQVDFLELAAEYEALRQTAPSRHDAGLDYLVDHVSVAGRTSSNRAEEHLAVDLLARSPFAVPDGMLQLVDFQVPLKAHRWDAGIVKIDLLGLSAALVVIELKILRPKGGADTPVGAALEALAYNAIVEANFSDITNELVARGFPVPNGRPEILVLGTSEYWHRWDASRAANGWRDALMRLGDAIAEHVGVRLWFGRLEPESSEIRLAVT